MNFDKTKAMRNAERFLAQGKLRSAIGEYRQVIEHDPQDFGTMNMLGDLYSKNSEKNEAVNCYTSVAEHYSRQGFAQKAIAVYNKISKIEPNSIEVSEKLAELYKTKGSFAEARTHFLVVAEHYQKKGKRIEALAMWKEIALLDPNNTEVYVTLGESYLEENDLEEAVDAFTNAGMRFQKKGSLDEAVGCFEKAMAIDPNALKALTALVEAKFESGKASEAVDMTAAAAKNEPANRELTHLYIDTCLRAGALNDAEAAVIRLVEIEPANYPKFLELAEAYLSENDLTGSARVLTMSSEHMLVGGQAEEFKDIVGNILHRDPEHLEALGLLVRYTSWQRDESAFRESLERLADVAGRKEAIEEERYALSQLVMIMPHEVDYADRLRSINQQHGYDDQEVAENLFDKRFFKPVATSADETAAQFVFESPDESSDNGEPTPEYEEECKIIESGDDQGTSDLSGTDLNERYESSLPSFDSNGTAPVTGPENELLREIDSIKFYIDNGYIDLAAKAVGELYGKFGSCPEIEELRDQLDQYANLTGAAADVVIYDTDLPEQPEVVPAIGISDLRQELGLDEGDAETAGDFETIYQTAIAYQEMGLLEEAIKMFQEAVSLVSPADGTRRFFQCANLLGHCFREKEMPGLALMWFQRTLETPGLNEDEKQGLWYELAAAYEAEGDMPNAEKYYEKVYAENVEFRDVASRIKNIAVER